MSLHETAFAKLNLALHVRARRPDGYHELETVFAFCEDGDELSFYSSDELTLEVTGPFAGDLTSDADNLVLRAARLLQKAAGPSATGRGAHILLRKNLPVASGLGGGSADAAAALRGLNRLWCANFDTDALAEMAFELGADVPACVYSQPLLGRGAGEKLQPVALGGLAGAPVLVANPRVPVSTAMVFRTWDGIDRGPMPTSAERALLEGRNDLQDAACAIEPAIRGLLSALAATGPQFPPRMSGSGASCFAIYTRETLKSASEALRVTCPEMWQLRTKIV